MHGWTTWGGVLGVFHVVLHSWWTEESFETGDFRGLR